MFQPFKIHWYICSSPSQYTDTVIQGLSQYMHFSLSQQRHISFNLSVSFICTKIFSQLFSFKPLFPPPPFLFLIHQLYWKNLPLTCGYQCNMRLDHTSFRGQSALRIPWCSGGTNQQISRRRCILLVCHLFLLFHSPVVGEQCYRNKLFSITLSYSSTIPYYTSLP